MGAKVLVSTCWGTLMKGGGLGCICWVVGKPWSTTPEGPAEGGGWVPGGAGATKVSVVVVVKKC